MAQLTEAEALRLCSINDLIASTRRELTDLKARLRQVPADPALCLTDLEIEATKLYKRLDGLGREKGGLLGKQTKLGPGDLNKRDRRAMARIKAGISKPGTLPKKRLEKLLKHEPAVITTYVAVDYRSDKDEGCICCPEKRGHGHIFGHGIHDLDDKAVDRHDMMRLAMNRAGVTDGDEFEVIIRKTGRRPFGNRMMLHVYPKDGVRPELMRQEKEES